MKNIYTDKLDLAYASSIWGASLLGLIFLVVGLFSFHIKLILLGAFFAVFILRKDIFHFAKYDRFFLVTLIVQLTTSCFLMVVGFTQPFIELIFISAAIPLVWTLFITYYLYKTLDWNE